MIEPYIATGEIQILKESSLPPSTYEELKAISNELLEEAPLIFPLASADEVLNFYFTIFSRFSKFEDKLLKFNLRQHTEIDIELLKAMAKLWMSGSTYSEISRQSGVVVEIVFSVIAQLFSYEAQSIVRIVNSVVTASQPVDEMVLGFGMEKFGECLGCGVDSEKTLNLTEAGVSNRLVVHALADWFSERGFQIVERFTLRDYLRENHDPIRRFLGARLPRLCVVDFDSSIGFLNDQRATG